MLEDNHSINIYAAKIYSYFLRIMNKTTRL